MQDDLPFIYPESFEDNQIEEKIQTVLKARGVNIIDRCMLQEVEEEDDEGLVSVVFKMLDIPEGDDDDEDEDLEAKPEGMEGEEGDEMEGELDENEEDGENEAEYLKAKKKRKKNEKEVPCKVLITAGHRDVDEDVFQSIHNNGLVYNGRLIVDKNFNTTDPSIFAAGSLCEFSGRYKSIAQGRPLRMDRYNGREMGSRLARSVFDSYDS